MLVGKDWAPRALLVDNLQLSLINAMSRFLMKMGGERKDRSNKSNNKASDEEPFMAGISTEL